MKVLLFDVETRPVRAWVWRTGKQYIEHSQIVEGDKYNIICICYKWLGEKKVHSLTWDAKQNSSAMVAEFSKLVESADLVVGHNLDSFDIKQVNAQRLLHDQAPISWPTSEDTLKQFRKYFYLPSHRLDYLSKVLGGTGKDRMNFGDWIDIVLKKCPKALAKMVKYCKRDVLELERIYLKATKYFKPKVHAGLVDNGDLNSCPRCAGKHFNKMGFIVTTAKRLQRYRCLTCGSSFSRKLSLQPSAK